MIRYPATDHLTPRQVFGLDVLLDLSRLLITEKSENGENGENGEVPAVGLSVVSGDGSPPRSAEEAAGEMRTTENGVILNSGLLDLIADTAGLGVEQACDVSDRHGRVPSSENPLVQLGLERTPLVSELAENFAGTVTSAASGIRVIRVAPWPGGHRWAAAMTHDLDVVSAWPVFTTLRLVELVKAGHVRLAARVAGAAMGGAFGGPLLRAAQEMLAVEAEFGLKSSWFLMAGTPTPATMARGDLTYRLESRAARRIVAAAAEQGCEFGLHGSFATTFDADLMKSQAIRVGAVAGVSVLGARQHFFRARPPETHRTIAAAGLQYDSSMGFPDRNGFRLGLADTVPCWDDGEAAVNPLELVPLTWMDRALSKYRGVQDPQAWIDDGLDLARTCRETRGLWVGLWHPNLCTPLGYPGAQEGYRRLVSGLAAAGPFLAPLAEIVAWRRARRSLRVIAVATDGLPVVQWDGAAGIPIDVETGEGELLGRCEVAHR